MFASFFTSLILFAVIFGARADQLRDDDSLVAKAKEVIQNVDNYLIDNYHDYLDLPNIGLLPLDPLKLRNGQFGNFSTIEIQDVPFINQSQLDDGSTVYDFDLKLGLKDFQVQYDFIKTGIFLEKKGSFSLSAEQNSMQVTGNAVVNKDISCDAKITSVKVLQYGGFKINIQPNDPHATQLSEQILNFVVPLVVPVTNKVLQVAAIKPIVENTFAVLTCKVLSF